ncbi:DUF6090 family protein [Winogradskyella schleiferi]|uniref:DUF6090 family protein n=1 Tax=Winogradskyella schleiferi TaxID=2686078 RepID=UPI0015BAF278|nr:DUF6090 family protein [Winogradskyella schleiferi]
MLLKKQIGKYLIYAFGEILLVMIGILLALKVNNLNEARIAKVEEKSILIQIKKDLTQEQQAFDFLIGSHNHSKIYFDKVKNNSIPTSSLDSLFYKLNIYQGFEPRNAGYIGLKSSNKIKSISSDSLRSAIIRYYENGLGTLTTNAKWEENFVLNYIEKYLIENNVPINEDFIIQDTTFITDELNKKKLNTLINYKIAAHKYLISITSSIRNRNISIVEKINNELVAF